MKQTWKRLVLALTVALLVTAALPVTASAASKTLQKRSFTTETALADQKAQKVKANYTYKLTMPSGGSGYLKFTAKEDAKYFFYLSGLTSKKLYSCGFVCVMSAYGEKGESLRAETLTTQGGKSRYLNLATKSDTSGAKVDRYRVSRYGKLKLKKGQTVYLYFSFTKGDKLKLAIS